VQEALTNVLRHAGASTVGLFVATRDGHLEATIEDDGQGATEGLTGAGVGLVGMRERVVALGGRLEVGPRPERGFCVSIVLPLPGGSE
jgi:signal transduction histidine kinase